MNQNIYECMNEFTHTEPITEEMSAQERAQYLAAFAKQETKPIRRSHRLRKCLIAAACVAVLGTTAAVAVSSAVGRSRIPLTGGEVNVADVNRTGTVVSEGDAAPYLLTLDELLYDCNGFGLLSFSVTNPDGSAVQKENFDLSVIDFTLDQPAGGYGLWFEHDGDVITSLQGNFFADTQPQSAVITIADTEYHFEDIQVTETSGLHWESDGLTLSPLGLTFDRYCDLNDAIDAFLFGDNVTDHAFAAIAVIRYKDGTEVECYCKALGGTEPHTADEEDRSQWRCQMELQPMDTLEDPGVTTQYCIDVENLESITIAGITYNAADAQTIMN